MRQVGFSLLVLGWLGLSACAHRPSSAPLSPAGLAEQPVEGPGLPGFGKLRFKALPVIYTQPALPATHTGQARAEISAAR